MIWDDFFKEKIIKIFNEKDRVLDIGGGLRVSDKKSNRISDSRKWIIDRIKNGQYKTMDPVADYNPDIVGDIHNMPFDDNTQDAIICLAVLEHVENPIKAVEEMYRVLKPGGYIFIYVPFLYYYHPERGYYSDYWRFTDDCLNHLFKNFSTKEIQSVRGAIATWVHISPLGRFNFLKLLANWLDIKTGKINSKQVSGYNLFAIK